MAEPRVRVVVLNYNGGDFIERTFDALSETDWPSDQLSLVMVDNASTDGSRDLIAKRFPDVEIIDSPTNAGFPANNLAMRSLADVDYLALINSDAFVEPKWLTPLVETLDAEPQLGAACPKLILAAGFVDLEISTPAMAATAADHRVLGAQVTAVRVEGRDVLAAISGSGVHGVESRNNATQFRWTASKGTIRIPVTDGSENGGPWNIEVDLSRVDGTESVVLIAGDQRIAEQVATTTTTLRIEVGLSPYSLINNAGSVVLDDGHGADRGFLQEDSPAFSEPVDTFAWCGGAVLLRPEYLKDVGLFDERFFLYYEDTDLSWRGQLKGWSYRFVPESIVRHMHAATSVVGSPTFRHYTERNRLAMLTKNAPASLALRAPFRFLRATAAYAFRDVVAPLRHRRRPHFAITGARLRSFGGWLKWLPALLMNRREIRSSAVRTDEEIRSLLVNSAEVHTD